MSRNSVPSLGYRKVTSVQGTKRKVHTAKKVDTTYSSQVWNIKVEGSMCLPGGANHHICSFQW